MQLSRQEMRLEPFWHVVAQRSVDYTCQITYQVPVHNLYAQTLQLDDKVFEVTRQKTRRASSSSPSSTAIARSISTR